VLPRISVRLARRDLPALTTLAGELAAGRCGDPALLVKCGITRLRISELAGRLGADPVPRLVAVPTDTSVVIDPRPSASVSGPRSPPGRGHWTGPWRDWSKSPQPTSTMSGAPQ
jgi:hypothetical protein